MTSRNESSSSSNNFMRGDANRSTFPRRRGMSTGEPYPTGKRPSNASSSQAADFQRGDPNRSSFARRRGMSTGEPYPSGNRPSNASFSQAADFHRGDPNRSSFARRRGMSVGQPFSQGNRPSDVAPASNFQRGDPNRSTFAGRSGTSVGQSFPQGNHPSDVAPASNFQRGDPNRSTFAGRSGTSVGQSFLQGNSSSNVATASNFQRGDPNRSTFAGRSGMTTGPPSQATDFHRGDPNRASFARRRGMSAGHPYPQGNRSSDVPKEQPVRADHSFGSGWRAAAQPAQAKNGADDLIAPLSSVSFKKPMEPARGQFNKSDSHGRNTRNSQQKMYDSEIDRSFRGGSSSNASFHNGTMIGIESHHNDQQLKSKGFSVFGLLGSRNAQQKAPPSGGSKDYECGHVSGGNENVRGNIQSTSSQGSESVQKTSNQSDETSFNKRVLRSNSTALFSTGIDKRDTSVCSNASFVDTESTQSKPEPKGPGRSRVLQKLGGRVAACLSKAFYCPDKTLPSIPKVSKKKSRSQRSRGRSSSRAKAEEGSSGDKTPKTVRRELRSSRSRMSSAGDSSDAEGMSLDTSFNADESVFDETADESFHVPAPKLKRSASSVSSHFSRKQSEDVSPKGPRTRSSVRMDSNKDERLNQTLDAYPSTGNVSFAESQMNQSFAGETGKKPARFVRNKSRASLRLDTSIGWSEFSMVEPPTTPPAGWRYVAFIKNLVVEESAPLQSEVGIYYTHDGFVKNMPDILVQNGVCYFFLENTEEPVQMPPHFEFNLFPDVKCSPGKIIAGRYKPLNDTDPRVEIFAKQLIAGNKDSLRDIYTQIVRPTPGSDTGPVFAVDQNSTQFQSSSMDPRQASKPVKKEPSVAPPAKRQLLLPKQVKAGRPENALPPTRSGELHTFSPPAQEGHQLVEPSTPARAATSASSLLASHGRWTVYKDEQEDHPSVKKRRNGDGQSTSTASHSLSTNPETPRSRNSAPGEPRGQFWRDCKRANPYAPQ